MFCQCEDLGLRFEVVLCCMCCVYQVEMDGLHIQKVMIESHLIGLYWRLEGGDALAWKVDRSSGWEVGKIFLGGMRVLGVLRCRVLCHGMMDLIHIHM